MKRKSIKEMIKEIKNLREMPYSPKCITGDEFESWLKEKKQDSIESLQLTTFESKSNLINYNLDSYVNQYITKGKKINNETKFTETEYNFSIDNVHIEIANLNNQITKDNSFECDFTYQHNDLIA